MTTRAGRTEKGKRIVGRAERSLTNIREELRDIIDDINTLINEGPKMGSYGHFVAGFDLTTYKIIKPALAELSQCDHLVIELEYFETYQSLAPNLTAMLEKSMDCEVCE